MKPHSLLLVAIVAFVLLEPPSAMAGEPVSETPGASLLAHVLTAMNVPARGIVCGFSTGLASIVMLASGGTRYGDAAQMMEEGCSGPWLVTPAMVGARRPLAPHRASVAWQLDRAP